MVHRLPGIPEALRRGARSLVQNVASVAVVAGGTAVVSAGESADAAALGVAGGQAALAAVLAYVYTLVKPAGTPGVSEVKVRAGRTLWQNLLSGAVVAGGAAVAGAAGADLKTLGLAAGQAAVAAVVAGLYNQVRPLPAGDGQVPAM
ncbi:hypothetical protein [Planomonospora algeriensis]